MDRQGPMSTPNPVVYTGESQLSAPKLAHLLLSPELHHRIYELVLTRLLYGATAYAPVGRVWEAQGSNTKCLSLLLISRRTFDETYWLFYCIDKLHFSNQGVQYIFLKNIENLRPQHVTSIAFAWSRKISRSSH